MRGLILWIEALNAITANSINTLRPNTIGDSVILAQSDTTAGFLCKNSAKLNHIKSRNPKTKTLIESPNLATLKMLSRTPSAHKNRVSQPKQQRVLQIFGALFSSSANTHKADFKRNEAIAKSDIVVLDSRDLCQSTPSQILQLGTHKIRKMR